MPKDSYTSVRNISGTSSGRYKQNNLSKKYLNAGGTNTDTCLVEKCNKTASATAHVMKCHGNSLNTWLLTKTCAVHNSHHNTECYKVPTSSLVKVKNI